MDCLLMVLLCCKYAVFFVLQLRSRFCFNCLQNLLFPCLHLSGKNYDDEQEISLKVKRFVLITLYLVLGTVQRAFRPGRPLFQHQFYFCGKHSATVRRLLIHL